jgi:hypothetical protein
MAAAAPTKTTFAKVGNKIANNVGGSPSARPEKGTLRPRGQSKGGMLEAATATHRAGIQERMGAQLHPTATLYAPNAAEAGMVQRNTVFVPSAIGNRDFYLRRQYGQGV